MKSWYLLHSQIQNFQRVNARIASLGVETYYPLETKVTRRKDCNSQRVTQKPLFPGYLFVYLDPEKTHTTQITDIPGANRFVSFGSFPAVVHDDIVEALKQASLLVVNSGDNSITCRNIPEFLLTKIYKIYSIKITIERQLALISLLQKSPEVLNMTDQGKMIYTALPVFEPLIPPPI